MMASEEPMVEVPIVFASSWEGQLNSLAIIDTHPKNLSQVSYANSNFCNVRFWISALTGYSS
jgi:hypothetical protein